MFPPPLLSDEEKLGNSEFYLLLLQLAKTLPSSMISTANFNSLAATKVHTGNGTVFPAAHHRLPIISRPISFISFTSPPNKSLFYSKAPIKAVSGEGHEPLPSAGAESFFLASKLPFHLFKTSFIATAVAAAALFLTRTHFFSCKPAIASPVISSTVQSTSSNDTETLSDEEKEKALKKYLLSDPNDVEALQSLMEIHVRNGKTEDSICIVDKLIELEPEEVEWPLMKAHIHAYAGDLELATRGFVEIIVKHPLKVEAYHGLVLAVSQDDASKDEALKEIHKKIEKAMKICEKEKKDAVLRDFKLMQAQVFVMEGKYTDALLVYQQLAQDDPKDFRPYLCQGIIFTVMRKKKEAEKYFEKYRSLVPNEHPYTRYFEDNMIATKAFAQEMENASKS